MQQGQLPPWALREGPSCLLQFLVLPEILDVPWFIANHYDPCLQLHTANCTVSQEDTALWTHQTHPASMSFDYLKEGMVSKLDLIHKMLG